GQDVGRATLAVPDDRARGVRQSSAATRPSAVHSDEIVRHQHPPRFDDTKETRSTNTIVALGVGGLPGRPGRRTFHRFRRYEETRSRIWSLCWLVFFSS